MNHDYKKRITATIDTDVVHKVREIQAWYMLKTNKPWSFSKALELLASEGILV
jgi:hypothetical protein